MDHALKMDRIYAVQRHFYDVTRRFYLLGRDRLLEGLPAPKNGRVLEVGCGTGRNLERLGRLRPDLRLCGVDISRKMLETAGRKLAGSSVELTCCPAERLGCAVAGEGEPFDAVFFSYSLSMIPAWGPALEAAWALLRPGGTLAVVDFWGEGGLPGWLHWAHSRWLDLFGVSFRPELLGYLRNMERAGRAHLSLESVRGGYAYLAWVRKITD